MLGLLEAAANYTAGRGASFETYAGIRIRGAMLDGLRKLDWAPRSVHRKARAVAAAIRELEGEIGREARDTDVAERMGVRLDEYHKIVEDAAGCRIASLTRRPARTIAMGRVEDEKRIRSAMRPMRGFVPRSPSAIRDCRSASAR